MWGIPNRAYAEMEILFCVEINLRFLKMYPRSTTGLTGFACLVSLLEGEKSYFDTTASVGSYTAFMLAVVPAQTKPGFKRL